MWVFLVADDNESIHLLMAQNEANSTIEVHFFEDRGRVNLMIFILFDRFDICQEI